MYFTSVYNDNRMCRQLAWELELKQHSFEVAGHASMSTHFKQMVRHVDQISREVLKHYQFDNTVDLNSFFTAYNLSQTKGMRAYYADFHSKYDFRTALLKNKGDDCLGLATKALEYVGDYFSKRENLKKIFPLDVNKPVEVKNDIKTDKMRFKLILNLSDESVVRIQSYIVGFLANTPYLPFYHFSTMIKVSAKIPGKERSFMRIMLDPGESMRRAYSHFFERNIGVGKAQIMSLNDRRDLLETPYFRWLHLDQFADLRKLTKEKGFVVEGYWRREQKAIVIDDPLDYDRLQKNHDRLPFFLLYPKIIRYNDKSEIECYISWNLLKRTVNIYVQEQNKKMVFEDFQELIMSGKSNLLNFTTQDILKSFESEASKQQELLNKIINLQTNADQFFCEMIDLRFARHGIFDLIKKQLMEIFQNHVPTEQLLKSIIDDEVRVKHQFISELFQMLKDAMLIRKVGEKWMIPQIVEQIAKHMLLKDIPYMM